MVEIETDYQEINELFYGEFRILEDAVVEVNTIDGDETEEQCEFARVAATDGEKYAFSTPIDRNSDEEVKDRLREVNRQLSNGFGHELDEEYMTGEYLNERA